MFAAIRGLKSPKAALEAFLILVFYTLANSLFTAGLVSKFRYLVIFSGFFSVVFRRGNERNSLSKALWVFFYCMLVISLAASYFPVISVLKTVSFFVGAYAIVEGFAQTRHLQAHWFKLVNSFFIFILLGSLAFLIIGWGFERNGRGFQGILTHPQTFGPVLAVVTAWFLALTIGNKKVSKRTVIFVVIGIVLIFLSLARTGMVALALGGIVAYLSSRRSRTTGFHRKKLMKISILLGVVGLISLLANPQIVTNVILPFVQKRNATTEFGELFAQSRGNLTVASMENFSDHPILGIGLGVPSGLDEESFGKVRYLGGIPVGASVEKGFLPSAILEEMGLIGALLTIYILWVMIARVRKRFTLLTFWVLLTALFINIGEAILFSLGGQGFFVWMIIGLTYNMDFFRSYNRVAIRTNRLGSSRISAL